MCDRSYFSIAVKCLYVVLLTFVVLSMYASLPVSSAVAQQSLMLLQKSAQAPAPASPASDKQHPDKQTVDSLVAVMDDEQVRRLLIEELKAQAAREQLATAQKNEIGGVAGVIHGIKNRIGSIRERIETLKNSDGVNIREDYPAIYKFMGGGEKAGTPVKTILSVVLVFIGAMFLDWVFRRYLLSTRKKIVDSVPPSLPGRLGRLVLRAGLDSLSIGVFTVAVIIISYAFLANTPAQRILVASYLAAIVIFRLFVMLFRFLFSVDVPALRVLPLTDATARYLSRWLLVNVFIIFFGITTSAIFRLAGMRELDYILMTTLIGGVSAGIFIFMILQKKKQVAAALTGGKSGTGLTAYLAAYWHHAAILGVVLILVFSTYSRVLYGKTGLVGIKTLLIIGLYILFDWLLRKALKAIFGFAPKTGGEKPSTPEAASDGIAAKTGAEEEPTKTAVLPSDVASGSEAEEESPEGEKGPAKEAKAPQKTVYVGRMKIVVKNGLRIALAVYALFWVLAVWGIRLSVGEAISRALFNILITVAVCYVGWELLNAKIQQKIQEEMPDADDEMEEGGAGGSRVATLLLILRRFFLAVIVIMATLVALSSVGVDIGPLIAGAGIIGLAIGLGAKSLVTDIISGLFFMLDDAFRIGDYIDIGSAKGMVEKLSIRSMKLRHPRGMVNTVNFGDIGTVTNFSRDYIITKLDFRIKYDTDVEKVRKIIKKKVYKEILKNEELAPKLLAPIKSQGVRQMEDSAMVMRVKYKTKPGEQFAIRKEVYRLMREAFEKAGIEFAHKNVTVYIPPEMTQAASTSENTADKLQLAAAAALAAEEEKKEGAGK